MKISRRQFISYTSEAALYMGSMNLLSVLNSTRVLAQDAKAPRVVMIHMRGGADVVMGLDPWIQKRPDESELFVGYSEADLINNGSHVMGPACSPLKEYANEISIINGVFLSFVDTGHDSSRKYQLCGHADSDTPLVTAVGNETEYGIFGIGTFNNQTSLKTHSVAIESLDEQVSKFNILKAHTEDSVASFLRNLIKPMVNNQTKIDEYLALRARPAISGLGVDGLSISQLSAAMAAGLVNQALIELESNALDTHDNHATLQVPAQQKAWTDVADIFKVFKSIPYNSGTLFENTLFVVTSDFSRTPALNGSLGKDHNPRTTSVLLAGYGVKKATSIGGSRIFTRQEVVNLAAVNKNYYGKDPILQALPIDSTNGQVVRSKGSAKPTVISPEHLAVTMFDILGLDAKKISAQFDGYSSLAHLI